MGLEKLKQLLRDVLVGADMPEELSDRVWHALDDLEQPQRKPLTDEQQVLRSLMERENNWANQGGAGGYGGDGKWNFVSRSIDVTPEELNALFKLAGVEPKQIVSKGSCSNCTHAINGRERGYERPCSTCCRPSMSNFEAAHGIKGGA